MDQCTHTNYTTCSLSLSSLSQQQITLMYSILNLQNDFNLQITSWMRESCHGLQWSGFFLWFLCMFCVRVAWLYRQFFLMMNDKNYYMFKCQLLHIVVTIKHFLIWSWFNLMLNICFKLFIQLSSSLSYHRCWCWTQTSHLPLTLQNCGEYLTNSGENR